MLPMSDRILTPRRWLAAVVCAGTLVGATRTVHADVTVALTPAVSTVQPGGQFEVMLDLTAAGSAINGFSAVLSYDPAVLTLIPSVPSSLQEGCLMTGVCSTACGNTFHQFVAAGDSIVINDYLFCNQVEVFGPGRLYKVRFQASTNPATTSLTIRRISFYNAGVFVNPVHATGATVQIPSSLGVGDGGAVTHTLRIEPNPARGRLQLVLEDGGQGVVRADILDLQGRLVRSLDRVSTGPRARLDWDGTDRDGKAAPGGLYLARIERNGRMQTSRFILLR